MELVTPNGQHVGLFEPDQERTPRQSPNMGYNSGAMATKLVDAATSEVLQNYGFDEQAFSALVKGLSEGSADKSNHLTGEVLPPALGDVRPLPPFGSEARRTLYDKGLRAIREGQVAAVILAGGMATRFGGVVKAAVPAILGRTFLDIKLADIAKTARDAGGTIPVFVMTSFATHCDVSAMCETASGNGLTVQAFPQYISLRVCPDGSLFVENDGTHSPYAPGHGDLSFALRRSGILQRFREGGGKILYMSNVDNLTATLDPAVIGAHLSSGVAVTAEVAPKEAGDKGGAPARVDGVPQIVESFRFPIGFDQDRIPVFNTNSFVLDAAAIDRDFPLTWFVVKKKVDGRDAVQFERLVGELTAHLPCGFLRVERHGVDARFQPVKDPEELEKRRPEILEALRGRGIL